MLTTPTTASGAAVQVVSFSLSHTQHKQNTHRSPRLPLCVRFVCVVCDKLNETTCTAAPLAMVGVVSISPACCVCVVSVKPNNTRCKAAPGVFSMTTDSRSVQLGHLWVRVLYKTSNTTVSSQLHLACIGLGRGWDEAVGLVGWWQRIHVFCQYHLAS